MTGQQTSGEAGAWAVFGGWRYDVERVVRKTPQKVITRSWAGARERHHRRDETLAILTDEQDAISLKDALNSSAARRDQAKKQADEQHAERVAKLVEALPDTTGGKR